MGEESDTEPGSDSGSGSGSGSTSNTSDVGWSLSFAPNAAISTRSAIAQKAGLQFGTDRDLYDVLGWKRHPTVDDYFAMYLRNPMGRVIVNAPAATSWRQAPDVEEPTEEDPEADAEVEDEQTAFERDVQEFFDDNRAIHYMERADKVSGIGEYGVIVLGLTDDTEAMADPVENDSLNGLDDLAYLATFSQDRIDDLDLVTDPTDERYGLPEFYNIEFGDESSGGRTTRVHWTRVIHIAEDLLEDEVHGRPRLEAVLNTLYDIEKVLGGAAEMTWRGAGLRMQLDVDPEMQVPNASDVAEQAEEMIHGLRHVMRTRGTEMNVIEGQTVDPSGITGELLKMIAGETGIPQRILTGSERGELASTQDRATFFGRIAERQVQFCEPQILRPLLDRLVDVGVIAEPAGGVGAYEVHWPPLFELSDLEQAELMAKMSKAMADAAPMGDTGQLATIEEIRQEVFDWDPERGAEVDGSVELMEEELDDLPESEEERDAFDELLESVGDLTMEDADVQAHREPARTDGGDAGGGE